MQRMKINESEVLDSFFDKAMADGMLDKQAEKLYPDFDISAPVKSELEGIVAVASHDNRLYGLTDETGEQLVGKAHPGGGFTIDLDNNMPKDKSLAKVETIVERQKVMRQVAEGRPTGKFAQALEKLISIANAFDAEGDGESAAKIDAELAKIAQEFNAPAAGAESSAMPASDPTVDSPALVAARENYALAQKAARLKANNAKAITMLNQLRAAEGLSPLAASAQAGVMTKEVRDELSRSAPGGYTTWRELFTKLQDKIDSVTPPNAPRDFRQHSESPGNPAQIPTPTVPNPTAPARPAPAGPGGPRL